VPLYVRTNINKFVKRALARNASAELTDRLLETTQLAEKSRERRKRVPRRVIQKGSVIEVHEARKQIRWTHNYNYNALKQRHKLIRMHHRKRQQRLMKELVQFIEKAQ
jgi:heterodisulfide reductase subunit A-like polyferredoxin